MTDSAYPAGLDSATEIDGGLPSATPQGGLTLSQQVTLARKGTVAVQTELGTNPSGSDTTVAERLDRLDGNQIEVRRRAPWMPAVAGITWITKFATGHGWTKYPPGADALTDLNSAERPLFAGQNIKMSGDYGSAIEIEKTGLSVNLTDKILCLWVYIGDSNSSGLVIFAGDSTFTNFRPMEIPETALRPTDGGWICLKLDPASPTYTGTLPATVQRIKIRINNPAGGLVAPHTIHLGALGYVDRDPTYGNGAITLSFDDTSSGIFKYAAPVMHNYGFASAQFLIGEQAELAGPDELSIDNLLMLQDQWGWDIGGHADRLADHVDMSTLSDAQAEDALARMKSWLVRHGFNGEHYAYPYGGLSATGTVKTLTRKYFASGRSVAGGTQPPIDSIAPPTYNQLYSWPAPSFDTAAVTLAAMKAAVDRAKAQKLWAPLVFHRVVSGSSSGPNIGAADFADLMAYISASGLPVVTPTVLLS